MGSIRSSKRNRATSPPEVAENRLSSAALSEEDLSDKPVTEDQAAGTTYRYFDFVMISRVATSISKIIAKQFLFYFICVFA